MKGELQGHSIPAPREEQAILDQIRNDRELIERLRITPKELEALSKCALLGTLTCKQDMLFILRQIREAGDPGHAPRVPRPAAPPADHSEAPTPDFRRVAAPIAPAIVTEPASLEGIVRRRMPEQFGILFWSMVLVAGLIWNGVIAMSRWRDNFMSTIGSPAAQAPPANTWYSHLDQANVLLWWEILFIGFVAVVMYVKSRRSTRHLKVRPARRVR